MLCLSSCLHNTGIIYRFPKILLISCIFVILSPRITNSTFCLSFLLISIWCSSIISFYNNGTFYNEKDPPTTPLSCYWIFISAIAQDSFEKVSHSNDLKSYTFMKIIKCLSDGVGRVIKPHCTQRHKITQLPASHHAGSCAPLLHPSYSVSFFWACNKPCKHIFVGSVSFSQSFHTHAVLAVAVKSLPIYTGLLCAKRQMLHDSHSASRHKLWITAR